MFNSRFMLALLLLLSTKVSATNFERDSGIFYYLESHTNSAKQYEYYSSHLIKSELQYIEMLNKASDNSDYYKNMSEDRKNSLLSIQLNYQSDLLFRVINGHNWNDSARYNGVMQAVGTASIYLPELSLAAAGMYFAGEIGSRPAKASYTISVSDNLVKIKDYVLQLPVSSKLRELINIMHIKSFGVSIDSDFSEIESVKIIKRLKDNIEVNENEIKALKEELNKNNEFENILLTKLEGAMDESYRYISDKKDETDKVNSIQKSKLTFNLFMSVVEMLDMGPNERRVFNEAVSIGNQLYNLTLSEAEKTITEENVQIAYANIYVAIFKVAVNMMISNGKQSPEAALASMIAQLRQTIIQHHREMRYRLDLIDNKLNQIHDDIITMSYSINNKYNLLDIKLNSLIELITHQYQQQIKFDLDIFTNQVSSCTSQLTLNISKEEIDKCARRILYAAYPNNPRTEANIEPLTAILQDIDKFNYFTSIYLTKIVDRFDPEFISVETFNLFKSAFSSLATKYHDILLVRSGVDYYADTKIINSLIRNLEASLVANLYPNSSPNKSDLTSMVELLWEEVTNNPRELGYDITQGINQKLSQQAANRLRNDRYFSVGTCPDYSTKNSNLDHFVHEHKNSYLNSYNKQTLVNKNLLNSANLEIESNIEKLLPASALWYVALNADTSSKENYISLSVCLKELSAIKLESPTQLHHTFESIAKINAIVTRLHRDKVQMPLKSERLVLGSSESIAWRYLNQDDNQVNIHYSIWNGDGLKENIPKSPTTKNDEQTQPIVTFKYHKERSDYKYNNTPDKTTFSNQSYLVEQSVLKTIDEKLEKYIRVVTKPIILNAINSERTLELPKINLNRHFELLMLYASHMETYDEEHLKKLMSTIRVSEYYINFDGLLVHLPEIGLANFEQNLSEQSKMVYESLETLNSRPIKLDTPTALIPIKSMLSSREILINSYHDQN